MKWLYISPNRDFSGYATAARGYIEALNNAGFPIVTRSLIYDGGNRQLSEHEKRLQNRDLTDISVVIQHTTPNEQSDVPPNLFDVRYFAWETDRVPDEWVKSLNTADLIMVPCDDNVVACKVAGVIPPVVKIEHAFNIDRYNKNYLPFDMPGLENHMKFLAICQVSKKKGVDALLLSYLSEFTSDDNVILVLKVYYGPNDGEAEKHSFIEQINQIKAALRLPMDKYPRIYVIHSVTSEDAIARLYATSDCYVLPSRGEGFGIPHFDALGFGLPAIGLDAGGTKEFINKDNGWLVKSEMSPCHSMPHPHSFMYTARDNWAEPSLLCLRKAMREAFQEWSIFKQTGCGRWLERKQNAKDSVAKYSYENIGKKMGETIVNYYKMWRDYCGHQFS